MKLSLLFVVTLICLVLVQVQCKEFVIECKVLEGNDACIDNLKMDGIKQDRIKAVKVTFNVEKERLGVGGNGVVHLVKAEKFEVVDDRMSSDYIDVHNRNRYFKPIWFDKLILKERRDPSANLNNKETPKPDKDTKPEEYHSVTKRKDWAEKEATRLKSNEQFNDLIIEFRTTLKIQKKIRALPGKPKSLAVEVLMFDENAPLYVMEALEKTLGEAVNPNGIDEKDYKGNKYACKTKPDVKTILKWYQKAFKALHQLHQVGYGHNDAKTDNFMVTKDGDVKILDFGKTRLDTEDVRRKCWNTDSKSWIGQTTNELKKYKMERTDDCWGDLQTVGAFWPPELHLGKYPTFEWDLAHVDMWYLSSFLFSDIFGFTNAGDKRVGAPVNPFATMLSKENNNLIWIQETTEAMSLIYKFGVLHNPNFNVRKGGVKFAKRSLINFMNPDNNALYDLFYRIFNVNIQFRPKTAAEVNQWIGATINSKIKIRITPPFGVQLPRLLRTVGDEQMTLVHQRWFKQAINEDGRDVLKRKIKVKLPLNMFRVVISSNYNLDVKSLFNKRIERFKKNENTGQLHPHVHQKVANKRAKLVSKDDENQRQSTLHEAYDKCRNICSKFYGIVNDVHKASRSIIPLKRRLRNNERKEAKAADRARKKLNLMNRHCSKDSGVLKSYPSTKDCETIYGRVKLAKGNNKKEDELCEPRKEASAICNTDSIKARVTKVSWSRKQKLNNGNKVYARIKFF